jgi:DNA replication protein DnaC
MFSLDKLYFERLSRSGKYHPRSLTEPIVSFGQGYQVHYYLMSRLFQDIMLTKVDGFYGRLANYLTKVDPLILDDWGLTPVGIPESWGLLDILDSRVSLH